jgi:hypothetical protein
VLTSFVYHIWYLLIVAEMLSIYLSTLWTVIHVKIRELNKNHKNTGPMIGVQFPIVTGIFLIFTISIAILGPTTVPLEFFLRYKTTRTRGWRLTSNWQAQLHAFVSVNLETGTSRRNSITTAVTWIGIEGAAARTALYLNVNFSFKRCHLGPTSTAQQPSATCLPGDFT